MALDITARLDAATADHRLLAHPFYQAWAAGTLSREDLRFYSTQYWRQVEAFPDYLENVASGLDPGAARDVILENLEDEVGDDHAGLWLRFADELGAPAPEVRAAPVGGETNECVERFRRGTAQRSPSYALGMLYAYESQTPEVARTKVEGLKGHYGIDGPAVGYFTLHAELDVEHSRALAGALGEVASDEEGRTEAEAGARAGAAAVWRLLDGVARVRGIGC